ncbi:MAG: cytochrome c-type biogenesis protein CcmH [Burkholderiales bacterium]|nr:cytochrome c-type biogenesis protein CcmH [Burkholderiales bacterium]
MSLALADTATPAAEDPVLEARVAAIAAELRCLVCQNQSLADSHADLAIDLKNQVRQMLRDGRDEAEIKDWMTARYGDFVLYKPPVRRTTWLLWAGPFVLLAAGGVWLARAVRRRRVLLATQDAGRGDAALDAVDAARVAALLGETAGAATPPSDVR